MSSTGSYISYNGNLQSPPCNPDILDPPPPNQEQVFSQNDKRPTETPACFSPLVTRVTDCFRSASGSVSRISNWSANTSHSIAPLLLGFSLLPLVHAETLSHRDPQTDLHSYSILDSLSSVFEGGSSMTYICAFVATVIAGVAAARFLFKKHTVIQADRIGMVNPQIHGDAHIHIEGSDDRKSCSPKEILALITTTILGVVGVLLCKKQATIQANSIGMLSPAFQGDNPIHQTVSGTGAVGMLNPQFYGDIHIHESGTPTSPEEKINQPCALQKTSYLKLLRSHPNFIGRAEVLETLSQAFIMEQWNPNSPIEVRLLWGIGGMGKTETAIQFGNHYHTYFSLIWMFNCRNEDTLRTSYIELAQTLKTADKTYAKKSLKEIRDAVYTCLKLNFSHRPWLLIFDNAQQSISDHALPERGGCVLVTAREKSIRKNAKEHISLLPFSAEESVKLLQDITEESVITPEMYALAKSLNHFPFVLNQVARLIKETPGWNIQSFSEIYRGKELEIEFEEGVDDRYDKVLKDVWDITFEKLQIKSPPTLQWIRLSSFFSPENIPVEWMLQWNPNTIIVGQIRRTLKNFGLMKNHSAHESIEESFSMHERMQDVIQWSVKRDINQWEESEREALNLLSVTGARVREYLDMPFHWKKLSIWASHATTFLQKTHFRIAPLQEAIIRDGLGLWMHTKGDFAEALSQRQAALELLQRNQGSEVEVARTLNEIGGTLERLGHAPKEALHYKEQALTLRRKVFDGQNHPDLAESLSSVAMGFMNLGDYPTRALQYASEALEMRRHIYKGIDHPKLATSMNCLGLMHMNLKHYAQALPLLSDALQMNRRMFQDLSHPDLAQSFNSFGVILAKLNRHQEALENKIQALQIYKKIHEGKNHPDVALSLNNVGKSYEKLGHHEQALEHYFASCKMGSRCYSKETPLMRMYLRNLIFSINQPINKPQKNAILEEILRLYTPILGESHPILVDILALLHT